MLAKLLAMLTHLGAEILQHLAVLERHPVGPQQHLAQREADVLEGLPVLADQRPALRRLLLESGELGTVRRDQLVEALMDRFIRHAPIVPRNLRRSNRGSRQPTAGSATNSRSACRRRASTPTDGAPETRPARGHLCG